MASSIEDRALDALARVAETNKVKTDLDLQLYARGVLDSIKTVELIVELGREFGLDISPAEFDPESWATPRHVIQFVKERVG